MLSLSSERWVTMVIDWVKDYIGGQKRIEKSSQLRYCIGIKLLAQMNNFRGE